MPAVPSYMMSVSYTHLDVYKRQPQSSVVNLQHGSAQYALYPVWLLNTTWQGNTYTFAMNGQTGKFIGDLPMDKKAYWKKFRMMAGIFAVIGTVLAAVIDYMFV